MSMGSLDHYWSENEIKRLKELWMEGLTARVIGMRWGCSRNAVVGKIRRLGMSTIRGRISPQRQGSQERPHVPLEDPFQSRSRVSQAAPPKPKRETPARPSQLLKTEQVSKPDPPIGSFGIMDLRYGVCKWPENDSAPWLFCGDKALEAMPYCEAHTRRARQGPSTAHGLSKATRSNGWRGVDEQIRPQGPDWRARLQALQAHAGRAARGRARDPQGHAGHHGTGRGDPLPEP